MALFAYLVKARINQDLNYREKTSINTAFKIEILQYDLNAVFNYYF